MTTHDLSCEDCGEPMTVYTWWKVWYARCWNCGLRCGGLVREVKP